MARDLRTWWKVDPEQKVHPVLPSRVPEEEACGCCLGSGKLWRQGRQEEQGKLLACAVCGGEGVRR
jgi:hypothetical protein